MLAVVKQGSYVLMLLAGVKTISIASFKVVEQQLDLLEKWDMEVGLKLTEAGMVKYGEHLDLLNPSSSPSLLESSPSSALATSKKVRFTNVVPCFKAHLLRA